MGESRTSLKRDIGSFAAHEFGGRKKKISKSISDEVMEAARKNGSCNGRVKILHRRRRYGEFYYSSEVLIKIFQKIENNEEGPLQATIFCFSLKEIIQDCIINNDFNIFYEAINFYVPKCNRKNVNTNGYLGRDKIENTEQDVEELYVLFKRIKEISILTDDLTGEQYLAVYDIYKEKENFLRRIIKEAIDNRNFYVLEEAIERIQKVKVMYHDIGAGYEKYFRGDL